MESMIFSEGSISDEAIYTLEFLVNHHIIEDYDSVRNLILGYDDKSEKWISSHAQNLYEKGMYQSFDAYIEKLKEKASKDYRSEKERNGFIKNNQMSFFEDYIYENIVIRIDEGSKRVLDMFFTLSKNVIEFKYIVDMMLTEWIASNVRTMIYIGKYNREINLDKKLHYYQLEIRETLWKEFKKICKTKGLRIDSAFKEAIIVFLEDRSAILKNDIMTNK